MEKTDKHRRRFLRITLLTGAFLAGLWKFLVPRVPPERAFLEVKKGEIPQGGALVYRQSRIAVIREGEEIYALSLVCTHLGCTVNVTPGELRCPCHGSLFDLQGKVLKGPADRPLERLEVEDRGESVAVLGGE